MAKMVLRAGTVLAIAGVAVVVGYCFYYFFKFLYTGDSVPLAIKVAIPAAGTGVTLLLVAVAWERYQKGKEERFEELET